MPAAPPPPTTTATTAATITSDVGSTGRGADLLGVMRTNGAARSFRDDRVDDAAVWRILDSARFAPSGGNKQGWHVVVVKDPATRRTLREVAQRTWREYTAQALAGHRPFAAGPDGRWHGPGIDLEEARRTPAPWPFIDELDHVPVLLVVTVDLTLTAALDVDLPRIGFVAGGSVYPFVQNILLAARTEGLGGVMTTFVVREEPLVQDLLGLPAHFAVASLIALGIPENRPTRLTRRPVGSFATIDRFDGPALLDGPTQEVGS